MVLPGSEKAKVVSFQGQSATLPQQPAHAWPWPGARETASLRHVLGAGRNRFRFRRRRGLDIPSVSPVDLRPANTWRRIAMAPLIIVAPPMEQHRDDDDKIRVETDGSTPLQSC